jgi:hypothetical protein
LIAVRDAVRVVEKDLAAVDAANDHMMECAGKVDPRSAGHTLLPGTAGASQTCRDEHDAARPNNLTNNNLTPGTGWRRLEGFDE